MNKTENIIYAIDRLINKPVRISCTQETVCTPKQRIIYKDEKGKDMVATVLGYTVDAEKKGRYVMPLEGGEETMFEQNQEKAAELFKTFKQLFRKAFPESKPISARMNLSGNHIYFYFFAETRFDFSEFVK